MKRKGWTGAGGGRRQGTSVSNGNGHNNSLFCSRQYPDTRAIKKPRRTVMICIRLRCIILCHGAVADDAVINLDYSRIFHDGGSVDASRGHEAQINPYY